MDGTLEERSNTPDRQCDKDAYNKQVPITGALGVDVNKHVGGSNVQSSQANAQRCQVSTC